ncbi:hypothetical protein [Puniceibacterium sp. IMCC21224]|uniref:hypothetical protein n=1 Tax=Puniceibacterium sp. IMCC21224 TaxID=1618204 RepID=UPI00064DB6B5|nr:hypothetical protein [Puniceibacterium sp. IMCC21224]KMK68593.1 hypothetical protein IMCC21224_113476 [Puniceibacterium sp. IMCC21224]
MKPLLLWIWHLDTRLTEIVLGSVTFARGATLALPGGMMAGESYRGFTFLPEAIWAVVFAVFGLAQLGAVVINGRWRRSPAIRATGALFGVWSFAALTAGFAASSGLSLASGLYGILTLWSAYCLINISSKTAKRTDD